MSSPSAEARNEKSTSSLDLPGDLRNRIYHLTIPTEQHFVVNTLRGVFDLVTNPLVTVGRHIGQEAASIWYAAKRFTFCTGNLAMAFLRSMSVQERGMIGHIGLDHRCELGQDFEEKDRELFYDGVVQEIRKLGSPRFEGWSPESVAVRITETSTRYQHSRWVTLRHVFKLERFVGEDASEVV